jgi:hypothetical protein
MPEERVATRNPAAPVKKRQTPSIAGEWPQETGQRHGSDRVFLERRDDARLLFEVGEFSMD